MSIPNRNIIGGNAKVVRNVNRAVILNLIREKQPISRIRIAKLTGLNKSTVSSIAAELLQENLIYEEEDQDKNVGRNPINLHLKLNQHLVGAINIDSAKTRTAIVDIDGSIKDIATFDTEAIKGEQFVARCVKELFVLRDKLGVRRLKGIGVSIAGIVDPAKAQVTHAPNLDWEDFEIGELLRALCGADCVICVENDSKAAALAELWFGDREHDLSDFVFLSVGRGIGVGIVVEGKLLPGRFHASGEFGHTIIREGGKLCSCGNKGCWEMYASDRATAKRYGELKGFAPDDAKKLLVQEVIDTALKNGELEAIKALTETGCFLGIGMDHIVKAIDPEAIIVGGRIVEAWDIIYPEIMRILNLRSFFGKKREIRVLPTSLRSRPQLLGAATLAIKELFTDYKITI